MNRIPMIALFLVGSMTAAAQETAAPEKIVATINGEVITQTRLDTLYRSMQPQMRAQYEKAGGKMAYLDNYIAKRLMIQEAIKSGFDKKPEVQSAMEAARESALFDRYVRDYIGSQVVTENDIAKFYQENKADFATPEQVKVRHIVSSTSGKSKEQAMAKVQQVAAGLHAYRREGSRILLSRFSEAARQSSEDGVASAGGDLGWVARGALDPKFEAAAFSMHAGVMSGIIETSFGYHLIFVEEKRAAGTKPLDEVRQEIREYLLSQRSADVLETVKRLTNELRASSKVAIYRENVK
ncbi:MAG: peptidylprolyl isomerase [Thermoanaerobaculia bacterium]|nr:peptidylprolyl isomerase [Thermoanaerobaculia bacterium]